MLIRLRRSWDDYRGYVTTGWQATPRTKTTFFSDLWESRGLPFQLLEAKSREGRNSVRGY
jgi:hypothetical protein